jgi:hypothetical protein
VYAFFANNAELTQDGRLHVFGGDFNSINVPLMPAMLQVAVVAKLGFDANDGDQHVITLEQSRPDEEWTQVPGARVDNFVVARNEFRPELGSGVFIIASLLLQITATGTFRVRVLADEEELGQIPLYINPVATA